MKRPSRGFTLVEVMVVIVVIGILAGIVILMFGNWREKNARDVLKTDLKHLSAAMENYRTANNKYPTTVAMVSTIYNSKDTTTFEFALANDDTYCINAEANSYKGRNVFMHIRPTYSDPQNGKCT